MGRQFNTSFYFFAPGASEGVYVSASSLDADNSSREAPHIGGRRAKPGSPSRRLGIRSKVPIPGSGNRRISPWLKKSRGVLDRALSESDSSFRYRGTSETWTRSL
jgi:hypothetical protein